MRLPFTCSSQSFPLWHRRRQTEHSMHVYTRSGWELLVCIMHPFRLSLASLYQVIMTYDLRLWWSDRWLGVRVIATRYRHAWLRLRTHAQRITVPS
jgi:hypothetical protein